MLRHSLPTPRHSALALVAARNASTGVILPIFGAAFNTETSSIWVNGTAKSFGREKFRYFQNMFRHAQGSVRVRSIWRSQGYTQSGQWSLLSLPCLPSPGCLQPKRHVEGLKVSSRHVELHGTSGKDLNFSIAIFSVNEILHSNILQSANTVSNVSRCIKLEVQVSSSTIFVALNGWNG